MHKNTFIILGFFIVISSVTILALSFTKRDKSTQAVQTDTPAPPENSLAPLSQVYVNTKYHYQLNYPDLMQTRPHGATEDADIRLSTYIPSINEEVMVKFGVLHIFALGTNYANLHQNIFKTEKNFPPHQTPKDLRSLTQELRDLEAYKMNPNNQGKKVSEVQEISVDNSQAYQYEIINGFDEATFGFESMLGINGGKIIITQNSHDRNIFMIGLSKFHTNDTLAQRMLRTFHFTKETSI